MLPGDLLERTEVVAGPATGGALLAHTMAGLLDGRRALTHPASSFAPFTYATATARARPARLLRQPRRRHDACCSPTTCATPARRSSAVRQLVERAGGTVIATVEICDRLEAVVDLGVPNYALAEYQAPENYRGRGMPDVPRRRADHDVLSIACRGARHAGVVARAPVPRLQPRGLGRAIPVQLVRPFARPEDREIAGFCAAALAFGRVASVLASISTLFRIMGDRAGAVRPRVRSVSSRTPSCGRWCTAGRAACDLAALLWILRQMLERSGSVEAFFAEGLSRAGCRRRRRARQLLDARAGARRAAASTGACRSAPASATSFRGRRRAAPASASTCSCAGWCAATKSISACGARCGPAQLIVPLDTHIIRLGAVPAADALHEPGMEDGGRHHRARCARSIRDDPVRFDFSICHVGMMNACGFGRRQGDSQCPLKGHCHPRVRRTRHPLARLTAAACAAAIALSAACRGGPDDYLVKSQHRAGYAPRRPRAPGALRDRLVRDAGDRATADGAQPIAALAAERAVQRDRLVARRQARRVRDQRPAAAALRSARRTSRPDRSIWCRATAIRRRGWREGSRSRRTARRLPSTIARASNRVSPRILALR